MNIVVLDTATVFEAEETTYRYDLTAGAVTEDSAAAKAIVEQAREVLQERWPEEQVSIEAPAHVVAVLTAAFAGAGVLVNPDAPSATPQVKSSPARRLNIPKQPRRGKPTWLFPALGAVVCCVGVACWWGIRGDANGAVTLSAEASKSHASRTPEAPQPVGQQAVGGVVGEGLPELPGVELSQGPLRVRLPEGFLLERREDGALSATGPDAELRILLAADPVYGVSSDAVYREVELMIEHDPTLEIHHGDGFRDHAVRTIDYQETPGDGSQVRWVTWVESDHQFSMGCHTRAEPTIPQLAACRMAAGTLHIHHDGGSPEPGGTEPADRGV